MITFMNKICRQLMVIPPILSRNIEKNNPQAKCQGSRSRDSANVKHLFIHIRTRVSIILKQETYLPALNLTESSPMQLKFTALLSYVSGHVSQRTQTTKEASDAPHTPPPPLQKNNKNK